MAIIQVLYFTNTYNYTKFQLSLISHHKS